MKRILIIDDHHEVGVGTKELVSQLEEVEVTFLPNSANVLESVADQAYDLILIDLHMPDPNGLVLTKKIKKQTEHPKIVIYTGFDVETHFNVAIEAGADGIVSKSDTSEHLLQVISAAFRGQTIIPTKLLRKIRITETAPKSRSDKQLFLSEREKVILLEIAKGKTNFDIANALFLSQRSVERELSEIYGKLKVSSRKEAVKKAKREKLIPEVFMK